MNSIKRIDLQGEKFTSLTNLFLSKNNIASLEGLRKQQMPKLKKLCLGIDMLSKMEIKSLE